MDSISKYPIKRIFNDRPTTVPRPRDYSKTLLFVDKATVAYIGTIAFHLILLQNLLHRSVFS